MTIGVISDTHIPESAGEIPQEVLGLFKDADLIIHAGDLTSLQVLKTLEGICPVKAVSGNMDSSEVCKRLAQKEILRIGKFSIGIVHGRGHPDYLLDFVSRQFSPLPEVVVFGHSHSPLNETRKNTLFFNPGSPTDKVFAPYNSCGILRVAENIRGEIIKL